MTDGYSPTSAVQSKSHATAPGIVSCPAEVEGQPVILLVEDHASSASALSFLLRQEGYSVVVAFTARQAFEIAAQRQVGLVITDLGLPDADGGEMMVELQRTYGLQGIALTGRVLDLGEGETSRGTFLKTMIKPIEFKDFLLAVRQALKSQS